MPNPEIPQIILDALFAVPAVGGDSAGFTSGSGDDPLHRCCQLRRIRRVPPLDAVINHETSIRARSRCSPSLPPGSARMTRVDHQYRRRGAVAYLAAYDVHHATVFGRCEDTTGIAPFTRLVEQVMPQEPYESANRVLWVVDNGSSHRGRKAIDRFSEQFPNAVMVHTPVHASWLNQVEIYFSLV